MSCVATPAHASESFEWRIRQHSAEKNSPVNCFSRGNATARGSARRSGGELLYFYVYLSQELSLILRLGLL